MSNTVISQREQRSIKAVSFSKSIMAYIIDSALTILGIVILFFSISSTVANVYGANEAYSNGAKFMLDSGLVIKTDSGFKTYNDIESSYIENEQTVYGYQVLEKKVWTYYTDYLVNDSRTSFTQIDEKTYKKAAEWTIKNLYQIDGETNNSSYYVLGTKDGSSSYEVQPALNEKYQKLVDDKDGTAFTNLKNYFTNSSGTGLYNKAFSNMSNQTYYLECSNKLDQAQYLAFLPCFIASPLIFFVLIPLFVPNGRTIGKLIFGLSVISKNGYKARKIEIFIHYLINYLWWLFLLLPNMVIGVSMTVFFLVMDYLFRIIRNDKRSFHDLISKTMVIDSRCYKVYQNKEEYLAYVNEETPEQKEDHMTWEDKYSKKVSHEETADDNSSLVIDSSTLKKNQEEKEQRRNK